MHVTEYLLKKKPLIQRERNKVLFAWQKSVKQQSFALKEIVKIFVASNHEGKCIRGALVCLGYELYGEKNSYEQLCS